MLEAVSQFFAEKVIAAVWGWISSHWKILWVWISNPPYYADLLARTYLQKQKVDRDALRSALEEHFNNIGLRFELKSLGNNYLEFKLSRFIAHLFVKWNEDPVHLMQAENEGADITGTLVEVEFTGYVVARYREFSRQLKEMARFLVEVSSLIANKFDGEKPELIITVNRTRSLSPFEGEGFAPRAPASLERKSFAGGAMYADQCAVQLIVDSVESMMDFNLSPFLARLQPCEKTQEVSA